MPPHGPMHCRPYRGLGDSLVPFPGVHTPGYELPPPPGLGEGTRAGSSRSIRKPIRQEFLVRSQEREQAVDAVG